MNEFHVVKHRERLCEPAMRSSLHRYFDYWTITLVLSVLEFPHRLAVELVSLASKIFATRTLTTSASEQKDK